MVRLSGEPAHPGAPPCPSPEWPPEAIVRAQLAALQRGDLDPVFDFLSVNCVPPSSSVANSGSGAAGGSGAGGAAIAAAAGSAGTASPADVVGAAAISGYVGQSSEHDAIDAQALARQRFAAAVAADARYAPLLRHAASSRVRQRQHGARTYLEIVAVQHPHLGAAAYCWVLKLEDAGKCLGALTPLCGAFLSAQPNNSAHNSSGSAALAARRSACTIIIARQAARGCSRKTDARAMRHVVVRD